MNVRVWEWSKDYMLRGVEVEGGRDGGKEGKTDEEGVCRPTLK